MKKRIRGFLPHLSIALCLGLAVLTVLDGFNPMMAFLTSQPSKLFIYCCCAAGIASGIECVLSHRRRHRRRERPAKESASENTKND